ncbi:EGFR adapter protein [Stomoxys calcitrans]|uniref:EGFR adapter protein n=1 Tax=Stomoxys calcitrans TaxID=35570 RepID=UPI0027E24AA7|nr:EGFR adapter protein [Stomoxys calcitrans]XP_013110624.2 EGFR adapter protein [Stomoxys calcitrans]XP_013110625.2 EGFR adapter protein [Stomoxys calcitrans]XP_013110626.2 EGFR adapter protein [Stomoxys calcitrans]XP_013110627.2 EGFR adapter protein [Stomoxys calcitrans]XP_013110629.2 EGFR adapter protein [Stomoxys calcitrans]XP_059226972.1 EGFR adapter protein [Stomoxys calcitrans]XP_059226973.1 EGFR adapter protein [Stomoxys calcitrans]XP_059226974.1 EGFR adapter protein [Stomoxys calci
MICSGGSLQNKVISGNKKTNMQDLRLRVEHHRHQHQHQQHQQQQQHVTSSTQHIQPSSLGRRPPPIHTLPQISIGCNDDSNIVKHHPHQVPLSPSSEEDNSVTEMNNCRRLLDKPPLVKRLTMGIGLKRSTEDSRPLVLPTTPTTLNTYTTQNFSDGYVNEAICDPDKFISTRFGDSCRQSLTDLKSTQCFPEPNTEFGYQKSFLRKTCSANSSPKIISPSGTLRFEGLTMAEENELKGAPWFQAGLPREISLEVLSKQNPGSFLVRQSNTKPGCFALSLRVPPPAPKVAHYLILKTPNGYKIKGFTKEFSSLRALITHHSVMPELLPVPLNLPRPTTNMSSNSSTRDNRGNSLDSGHFDTYGSLNDFRKMMSDLNV